VAVLVCHIVSYGLTSKIATFKYNVKLTLTCPIYLDVIKITLETLNALQKNHYLTRKSFRSLNCLRANIRSEKQKVNSSIQTPQCDAMSFVMQVKNEFFSLCDEVLEAAIDTSPVWWSQNSGCFKRLAALAKKHI
jgi:hypothetical protein